MKIAMVCPYDIGKPGGVQHQAQGLAERVSSAGFQVNLVSAGMETVGATVSVPANRSRAPVSLRPRTWAKVRAAIGDADLLHVHEPFIPVVGWSTLGMSVPKVLTFHADPSVLIRRLYRLNQRWLARLLSRSQLTAVSPIAASALPRHWDPPQIIPNGLDVPQEGDRSQKVRGQIVFVGRDEPRKGLDSLLAAWPLVARQHPTARLVVISPTTREDRHWIRWEGQVNETRKSEILAQSEVIVTPNLGGESFGIVLAEGMAAGCAPVISDLPAFRWVAGESAAFFPPGDSARLASTLISLLAQPEEIERRGILAHQLAQRFSWERVSAEYLSVFERAMGGTNENEQS